VPSCFAGQLLREDLIGVDMLILSLSLSLIAAAVLVLGTGRFKRVALAVP